MEIIFKSDEEHYWKEKSGIKPNTVREVESTIRFEALREITKELDDKFHYVRINLKDKEESFARIITDITFWKKLCIISWKHPSDN